MSRVRPAVLTQDDLPDTMTAKELADYERVDVRTLRLALDAGEIAGAYRRGSSWRINKAAYFAGLGVSSDAAND